MPKNIFAVEFSIPIQGVVNLSASSDRSLLDADIVIFKPSLGSYDCYENYHGNQTYQGKPLLNEASSFEISQRASHWRTELNTAFKAGKTIFVYLVAQEDVFIYTGQRQFSGTGRSRVTTNVVAPFNNYRTLPVDLGSIIPRSGNEIKPAGDFKIVASYWSEFSRESSYEVYLESQLKGTILTTKTGSKTVGAIIKGEKGAIVLLPPVSFPGSTTKRKELGSRLINALIEIDKELQDKKGATPAPEWTNGKQYRIQTEARLEQEIKIISEEIERVQNKRSLLALELEKEGGLRRLLYETGIQLEAAIIDSLILMGFQAEGYQDAESEFDAVFVCPEGRCLGETEGKDNKAINIDKLSQLERNIQEDFAKEGVTDFAKGVLFGNAYRLTPPAERGEFFTAKCISGAKRSKVALVRTPDLFDVARYLRENDDLEFAKKCRKVIVQTEGEIVVFPVIPIARPTEIIEQAPTSNNKSALTEQSV
jgi:hypothetical protein